MASSCERDLIPIGELSDNFDALRRPVKEADRVSGPYAYYGASGIVDWVDNYLFDGEYLLVAEDGENLKTRKLPVAFLAKGKFWVNNHVHILRANHRSDTRFLLYALLQADIAAYLTGSTMPKLTQQNLNRIPVQTPPLPEQRAIAHILGMLDDKIELNRRMNRTLEELARALFHSWFVAFDPVRAKAAGRQPAGMDAATAALFPDSFKETEHGEIPAGWRVVPIGDAVRAVGGSTPRTARPEFWDGNVAFCTPKDLSTLPAPVLLGTSRHITNEGLDTISSGKLPAGTVLMSSRAPIGYMAISGIEAAVNQGMIAMICDGLLPCHYVYFWAGHNMDEIKGRANGTTFLEISKRNFRPMPALIPSSDILARFEEIVTPLFDRVEANERETTTLATARDSLLPKLLSGQMRVGEVAEAAAAASVTREPG